MRKLALVLIPIVVLVALSTLVGAQAFYSDEAIVSRYWKFDVIDDVNSFKLLMLNTSSNTISDASSTYVTFTVENSELKISDLAADNILPVLGLPTYDHMYVIYRAEGDFWVKVLNYNETTGTFTELGSVHVSPYGDITIVPLTSKGLVIIYVGLLKLHFNVSAWNLIAIVPASEESTIYIDDILEGEIPPESLSAPFSGTEVSGADERTIEVSVNGQLRVWFWESHDVPSGGDADLFVFKSSNSYYSQASHEQTWNWLASHADDVLTADWAPQERTYDFNGSIKLVVKFYEGTAQWRLVYATSSSSSTVTVPETTPGSDHPSAPFNFSNVSWKWIAIGIGVLIFIVIVVALMVRR